MGENETISCLLWRSQGRLAAIPIEHVAEIMRPLEIAELTEAPPFVSGASIIRGRPTPIVEMGVLLSQRRGAAARVVVLKAGPERHVGLAVDEVVGVRDFASAIISDLPPLFRDAGGATLAGIAALDGELMLILRAMHLVPESVWSAMEGRSG